MTDTTRTALNQQAGSLNEDHVVWMYSICDASCVRKLSANEHQESSQSVLCVHNQSQ